MPESLKITHIEVVDIARQLEVCGEAYYAAAAEVARDPDLRSRLGNLRDEERHHARVFNSFLDEVDATASWRFDEHYETWMRAFALRRVFPDPEDARRQVAELDGELGLLRRAIEFEEQSVEFMQHFRDLLPDEHREIGDRLVAEEREHERLLRALLTELQG